MQYYEKIHFFTKQQRTFTQVEMIIQIYLIRMLTKKNWFQFYSSTIYLYAFLLLTHFILYCLAFFSILFQSWFYPRTNLSQSIIYIWDDFFFGEELIFHIFMNIEQWCIGSIVLYWIEICHIATQYVWYTLYNVHHSVAWSQIFLFIFYWPVCVYVWDGTIKVVDCKTAGNTNTNIILYKILKAKM